MSWGWYRKDIYYKNSKGCWKLNETSLEKVPFDVGRWEQSCQLEKNSSLGEKTYFTKATTRSGINQKVTQIRTYFKPNKKVVRTLITTSNNIPKHYERKKK